jgi:nicotinamidase-related amidase
MPRDITPFIDPATTAIVALECQERLLLPERAMIPGLAANAEEIGLIDRLATLFDSARRVGATIAYVSDHRRLDGIGQADNLMVGRSMEGESDSDRDWSHGPIVAKLTPHPNDITIRREHGMTGFYTTPLDAYLRNCGIKTVILVGASANIAVNGTALEAMNLGYRVMVPSDCIAGDPPEYVPMLLKYTIRNVAMVTTAEPIVAYWDSLAAGA